MSQTVITLAFEQYKAQQEALVQPVALDEFVLANVPNQDPTLPIDRSETLPPQEQIVHVGDVSQSGYVNPNGVVYSLIMDTSIGDFDFNWIGLRNKNTGLLAAISHAHITSKIKTTLITQNGNAITRSVLMSYSDAKNLTNINVEASTWQIDFTARLFGIDEAERLANLDHYGVASFLDDGFKVIKDGSAYKAQTGIGYVGGLRCSIENDTIINTVLKPSAIYLDASWQGQIISKWNTVVKLESSTNNLTDYIDAEGYQHYVTKIADIDGAGNITDTRYLGGTPAFERVDNAATNAEIDAESTATKHVKLTQLWRAVGKKITDALLGRTILTTGAMQGGGDLSANRTISIKDATTAQKGAVQLSNSVISNSENLCATPKAVKTVNDLVISGQFLPWDSTRVYKTGEICTVEVAGEVKAMQMYAGPNLTCINKNPANPANRHENWASSNSPFWWIPYTGTEVGMPFWWLNTVPPETAVMEINSNLPIVVYWRLARRYPALVSGNYINTGEIRGEFLRVLDQGRGADSSRGINNAQADSFRQHYHTGGMSTTFGTVVTYIPPGFGSALKTTTTGTTGGGETRPRNITRAMAITI